MKFTEMRDLMHQHTTELFKDATHLFEVNVDKDELWSQYLESFDPKFNKIFRERREHDCSCCRQFVRNIGNAVVIKDNQMHTIWDFNTGDEEYQPVLTAMSNYLKGMSISDIYVTKDSKVGTMSNKELLESGKILTWEHHYLDLPKKFVDTSNRSEGDIKGSFRDVRNVFKRSLEEITEDSVLTVLELIGQNSLYKGEEWKAVLNQFLTLKREYDLLTTRNEKDNYTWAKSVSVGGAVGKIRNHSMGTLLTSISEGMELDIAVKKYEAIVAPSNYKRPKAVFTQKMLDDAKNTVQELGYGDSLGRRHATLDDITVNNILFVNKDSASRVGATDIFDEMSKTVSVNPKKFSKVEEVSIDKFIEDILPTAKELELFLENKHSNNMASLIAPKIRDSKTMFKWNNNFSWSYSGNITDSSMKDRVKSAGGKVDGDLRFSIQWNDIGVHDRNDLDAHCVEPSGEEIMFNHMRSASNGRLDVDNQEPIKGVPAVENITWASRTSMKKGIYRFFVRNFANRGGRDGFRAELEFDGEVYSFDYAKELRNKEDIAVVDVNFDGTNFSVNEKLSSATSSKEVWGLSTNQFVPVSVAMFSPNYWDEQSGIGNRHYFFMLKDCVNSESPNGFFNEYLKQDLDKHKRVFEALGGKMAVESTDDQLSGVGFSSTKRAEVIVKVKGQTERVLKIKF